MKVSSFKAATLLLLSLSLVLVSRDVFAASAGLLKAQKEAEAKGFIFETGHDEIVAKAKKGGAIQILSSSEPASYPHLIKSFKNRYPFLEVKMVETSGTDAAQRFLLELKTGRATEFDVVNLSHDYYPEYLPFAKKFDILGMAEQGVLNIPLKMVDPKNRTVVSLATALFVVAYNKNLISAEKVPNSWEDFLKPEFKGKKFMVEVRPLVYSIFASCPEQGLGEEWMVNYAKKMRAQEPVWIRGHSRGLAYLNSGEQLLHSGTYYHSAVRLKSKSPKDNVGIKFVEPVPATLLEPEIVLNSSRNPYSALLFLEHEASPEGQKILDDNEPLKASIHFPLSAAAKEVKGKKVCLNDYKTFPITHKWEKMAVEAFGFPREEKAK
ncbi:MAG: extracellular solute-binding protein [Deltaproteobacteria bacterium]|nr:extracellular solute-binding protein [Deltaproteobacteria bacterium]